MGTSSIDSQFSSNFQAMLNIQKVFPKGPISLALIYQQFLNQPSHRLRVAPPQHNVFAPSSRARSKTCAASTVKKG